MRASLRCSCRIQLMVNFRFSWRLVSDGLSYAHHIDSLLDVVTLGRERPLSQKLDHAELTSQVPQNFPLMLLLIL